MMHLRSPFRTFNAPIASSLRKKLYLCRQILKTNTIMAKYLDPKADLTFKKVFGEHPDLVMSLLNALLPLEKGKEITDIHYLPPERVPRTEEGKDSIVDVFCETNDKRQFIVEMQMYWSTNFMQRVLFNSSKVYVGQLKQGEPFSKLQPVYSLNLIDDIFEP